MKIIQHILLYLLTFVGYMMAMIWAIEHGPAKVPTSDAMGQGMKDALSTLIYTVLAIAVVYAASVLIAKFLLKGSAVLSAFINAGLILLWIAIIVFASMNKKEKKMSDFFVLEINTPCLYPITVCDCKVTLSNGDAYQFGREMHKTIAVEGSAWGKGGEIIHIPFDSPPAHIDISYLSYVEDKVYHVEGDFPIERFNNLYDKKDANEVIEKKEYDGLVIGCAPYGIVQIWLRSDLQGGKRTELCTFQGKSELPALLAYIGDSDGFYYKYDKKKVRSDVWKNVEENGLPDKLWFENSNIRYNYRIVVETEKEDTKLLDAELSFCNGEYDNTLRGEVLDSDYQMLACPAAMSLEWQNKRYRSKIKFDPEDIAQFFKSCYGDDCIQPGDFILQFDDNSELRRISLKVGEKIYQYQKNQCSSKSL